MAKDSESLSLWFSGFRRRQERGQADVVFLQETRATAQWAPKLQDQYAREWGFRPEQLTEPLSYWKATPTAAGGVAILLRPNGIVQDVRPLWEDHWSPWFMAITATVLGHKVHFVNVYGPSDKPRVREAFYERLRELPLPAGQLLLGGDFNCTLDSELDRSRASSQSTDSPALHSLLESWSLVDAAASDMATVVTQADKMDFYARHHTYQYSFPDGSFASSRLDRWYVGAATTPHVVGLMSEPPVNFSDHNSVTLRYVPAGSSPPPTRRRRPRLRYPLPFGCRERLTALTTEAVTAFTDRYAHRDGAISAGAWDALKNDVRRRSLVEIRSNLRRQRKSIRQRRRRLQRALQAALYAAAPRLRPLTADVASITAGVEAVSLEPVARVNSLRRALVRLERRRGRLQRRRTFEAYATSTPAAERAFFRRFSTRQGHRGPVTLSSPRTVVGSTADQLAHDWSAITQRGSTEEATRRALFAELPVPAHLPCLAALDAEFSEGEVREALLSCPRGKAAGPDGLPNDWYRDYADLLVPVLTTLFNRWHLQRTLPPSFRHATVACIPKTVTPASGLDFRPIALLDTDYKIYARVLLNRLSPRLPELVSPTQFGFVSGRQVHDALDVFHGIQKLVREGAAPASAVAVLLDFAKAYDTLDRDFLLQALERLGFPTAFRDAVKQMHLHTTAEYVADEDVSAAQPVLNGIRQGCPLAPTLFVLAVNTLYELLHQDPAVQGVRLPDGDEVCATGYADDTTCYLESASSAGPLRAALDRFGDASGLRVNVNKCVGVFLGHDRAHESALAVFFPVAAAATASRLLGGQVATADVSTATWSLTMQHIRARLHWAELKTTNESQRVKLVRAILLPKFLFVARHEWPNAKTVEKFQGLTDAFVWSGSLAAEGPRRRAWMSSTVARAPRAAGGFDVPHLTHELQTLSLRTVERWARPGAGVLSAIGQVLLRGRADDDGFLAPSRRAGTQHLALQSTLAATGIQVRRAVSPTPRSPQELELLGPLFPHVGKGTSSDFRWDRGWLAIDYTRVRELLLPLQHWQGASYGNLQVHALLRARICGEDVLLSSLDKAATPTDFPGVFRTGDRIEDVVRIGWDSTGGVRFQAVQHDFPLPPAVAIQFRRLCDTIVFNYPAVLRPPGQPEDMVLRPPTLDVWRLRQTATGHVLEWSPLHAAAVPLGVVSSTADATALARKATGVAACWFERHSWLDAPFALWTGVSPSSPSTVHALLRRRDASRCAEEQDARLRRWTRADDAIAQALSEVKWGPLMETDGAPSSHRLLFHKLKGDRLPGWERVHERVGCPHCPAIGAAGGSAFHIAWACPKAQDRWRQLLEFWAPLDGTSRVLHSDDVKQDVFSLSLRVLPSRLWRATDLVRLGEPTAQETVAVGMAVSAAWRLQVLATLHVIWRWRTTPDTLDEVWSPAHARARHGAVLLAVDHAIGWRRAPHSAATKFTAAALDALFSEAPQFVPPPPIAASTDVFLLFFDGGARHNPGIGGAGSVVVRVDGSLTHATLVWSAATSLGSAATNNQAEYQGLLTGLTMARDRGWRPLHVVGDSQLILGQMERYRPPRNQALLELYAPARRLADELQVLSWSHHRRAFNCMADAVANVAMDDEATSSVEHPTLQPAHADIARHLAGDFLHWQARHLVT